MDLRDLYISAKIGLGTHKGRTIMTIVGIVIGISAITMVMSVGLGAQKMIVDEVQSMGANNVFVMPGKEPSGMMSAGLSLLDDSMKIADVEALRRKENVPDAVLVNPTVTGSFMVSYENEGKLTTFIGSGADVFDIYYNIPMERGARFTQEDVLAKTRVAVIGRKVAEDLFGGINPVGENIKIKNEKYRVLGVMGKSTVSFFNVDDMVIVPYTAAQQYTLGIRYFHEVAVQARDDEAVPAMVSDIERTLRDRHNIDDPDKDDFYVQTMEDIIKSIQTVTNILTVFLTMVAAVSLVVGGVGVMNIMLVSVTERTKEIGLRKALGATNKSILRQFLLEAIILTGSGGVVGVVFGTILTALAIWAIQVIGGINFAFVFSVTGAVVGVLVATLIGLIFGIFPALQAAKKSPIEALRG